MVFKRILDNFDQMDVEDSPVEASDHDTKFEPGFHAFAASPGKRARLDLKVEKGVCQSTRQSAAT